MEDTKLTQEEIDSALWKKLEAMLIERLEMARKVNDTTQTKTNTTMIRGRISAYKEVLWLNPNNTDI
jgi:hypothetical protein